MTIAHTKLYKRPLASQALSQALLDGPATFYQLCERANVSIETEYAETVARVTVSGMISAGAMRFDGIMLSTTTRAAPVAHVGQVATSHHRGPSERMPVLVVRASQGARA